MGCYCTQLLFSLVNVAWMQGGGGDAAVEAEPPPWAWPGWRRSRLAGRVLPHLAARPMPLKQGPQPVTEHGLSRAVRPTAQAAAQNQSKECPRRLRYVRRSSWRGGRGALPGRLRRPRRGGRPGQRLQLHQTWHFRFCKARESHNHAAIVHTKLLSRHYILCTRRGRAAPAPRMALLGTNLWPGLCGRPDCGC